MLSVGCQCTVVALDALSSAVIHGLFYQMTWRPCSETTNRRRGRLTLINRLLRQAAWSGLSRRIDSGAGMTARSRQNNINLEMAHECWLLKGNEPVWFRHVSRAVI